MQIAPTRETPGRTHATGPYSASSHSSYLDTKNGRLNLCISVKAKDGLVRVVVEELKPGEPKPAEA